MTSETSTDDFDPRNWIWGVDDREPRLLHTMIRVNDFEASLRFYVDGLGMKVLMKFDVESRRVSAMFIGFGDFYTGGVIELTRQWDVAEPYSHGTHYGHVSVGVPDVEATVAKLESMGVEIETRPTKLKPGAPLVAFVKDPDGCSVELIQTLR